MSPAEFGKAAIAERQPKRFDRLDSNGDGYLSGEEAARLTWRRR